MIEKSIGFIGGGRVTRIILGGLKRSKKMPQEAAVSDIDVEILNKLKKQFPEINIYPNDNKQPASKDIVFLALHHPVVGSVLGEIKSYLKQSAVFISFAPKITTSKLMEGLGGFNRITRMIPNACSIVNYGYNPVTFSQAIKETEKEELMTMFKVLGNCPIVAEEKLELYAILTGMGPTYLWFQLYELQKIIESFGLTYKEAEEGIASMVIGAVKTMFESRMSSDEVMDLIPFKPLKDGEENIKNIYRSNLEALYKKLKG